MSDLILGTVIIVFLMSMGFRWGERKRLRSIEGEQEALRIRVLRGERRLMTLQEKIDAIGAAIEDAVSAIGTATDGIRGDIQALKDQIANNQPPDFTALDASVAKLDAVKKALSDLDAENPTPPTP